MTEPCEIHPEPSDQEVRPHGLLVFDKPPGPTSYDCIRFLKRTCRLGAKWKIGHLGTLDPFASGVLLIALGQATRYASFALESAKKYRARLWLGDETDTLDPTGTVIASAPVPPDWPDRLPDISCKFIGIIEQAPPAFSAKQVDGKRSYRAARAGAPIDLEPVEVEIYSLEFTGIAENWVDFTATVSGGTYIRALGRDIAKALGTVGHLLGLERIASGRFPVEEAIPMKAFEVGGSTVMMHHLRPVDQILEHLRPCMIRDDRIPRLLHGGIVTREDIAGDFPDSPVESEVLRFVDSKGGFLALGRVTENPGEIVPFKPWLRQ